MTYNTINDAATIAGNGKGTVLLRRDGLRMPEGRAAVLAWSDRISAAVRQSLLQAADIFISPVTAWEIAVKCQSGKMKLPLDPGEWFRG